MESHSPKIPGTVRRPRLSTHVADELRHLLDEGVWGDRLPGVHALMERLGVSAPPVQEALEMLERQGRIGPARPGKGRGILSVNPSPASRRLLVCSPVPAEMTSLTQEIQWEIEPALAKLAMPWQGIQRHERRKGDYLQGIAAIMKKADVGGVIGLDVPHRELREAVGPSVPLLQVGSLEFDDPRASSIAVNLSELLEVCLLHLFRLRYKRIGLLCPFRPNMHRKLLDVMQRVHDEQGLPFSAEAQFPFVENENLARTLRQMIAGRHLDLLLTVRENIWTRVVWELNGMNVRVPVLNLWNASVFRHFESPPCLVNLRFKDFPKAVKNWCAAASEGRTPVFRRSVGFRILFHP